MSEQTLIKLLKISISIGLCLLLLGIYLHNFNEYMESLGVTGIIISAVCIAFGLIFSLPTKMFLTFILVTREAEQRANEKKVNSRHKIKPYKLQRKTLNKINNCKVITQKLYLF